MKIYVYSTRDHEPILWWCLVYRMDGEGECVCETPLYPSKEEAIEAAMALAKEAGL